MPLLGWVWLASPFVLIALVSRDRRLQGLVASHHALCRAAGCAGAVTMFVGAALAPEAIGMAMLTLGTPLTGLVVFLRSDDGDDGRDDEPDVPPVDWEDFERSFWAHVRGGRSPRRPHDRSTRDPRPTTSCGV